MYIVIGFEVLTVISLISVLIVMFKFGKKSKYRFIPMAISAVFGILTVKTMWSYFTFMNLYYKDSVYAVRIIESNRGYGYPFLGKDTLSEITSQGMYDKVTLQFKNDLTEFDKQLIIAGFQKADFDLIVESNTGQIVDKGYNFSPVNVDINGTEKILINHSSMTFDTKETFNISDIDTYVLFYALDSADGTSGTYKDNVVYSESYIRLNN